MHIYMYINYINIDNYILKNVDGIDIVPCAS